MLENIKMLLGIIDNSKDSIINYWIKYYTQTIKKYCHICGDLSEDLISILEQIVVDKMGGVGSGAGGVVEQPNGNVKSITRGDYSVTYFSANESTSSSTSAAGLDDITIKYQGQLNLHRRFDY